MLLQGNLRYEPRLYLVVGFLYSKSMERNILLFLVFLVGTPVCLFLFKYRKENHKDENKRRLINFIDVINLCYIVLVIYLFNAGGPTLVALALIIGASYFLKGRLFDKLRVLNTNSLLKNIVLIISKILLFLIWAYAIFVGVATALALYSSYYEELIRKSDPNVFVTACKMDTDSCYRLEAYYIPRACAPVEYSTRGAYGGECYRDAYIEKIYFENGGYITFEADDCNTEDEEKWICSDKDGDYWGLELKGAIKSD